MITTDTPIQNTTTHLTTTQTTTGSNVTTNTQVATSTTTAKTSAIIDTTTTGTHVTTQFPGPIPNFLPGDGTKTWEQAANDCVRNNGRLPVPMSIEENDAIYQTMQLYGFNRIWLGFNDLDRENEFVDIEGTAMEYANWFQAQPDNYENEDCVEMFWTGSWNDYKCSENKTINYICDISEIEVQPSTTAEPVTTVKNENKFDDMYRNWHINFNFAPSNTNNQNFINVETKIHRNINVEEPQMVCNFTEEIGHNIHI